MPGNYIPRLSIGLPVRNGESVIERAIDSLLNQTFTDFELVIVDNCSTDDTVKIVEDYQQQDSRVKLYKNKQNIGQLANFDMALELASGELFMWASADDFWREEFAETLVATLDSSAEFDAATGAISRVTPSNKQIDVIRFPALQPHGNSGKLAIALRIAAGYSNKKRYHLLFYSMFRRNFLIEGLLYSAVKTIYPDRAFMCQYALSGTFGYVDRQLMSKTVQTEPVSSRYPGEFPSEVSSFAPWGLSSAAVAVVPFLIKSPLIPAYKTPLIVLIFGAMLWGYRFDLYRGNSPLVKVISTPYRLAHRIGAILLRRKSNPPPRL